MKNRTVLLQQQTNIPPQNIEAEESILAAVLLDNNDLNIIREILKAEDFYRLSHAKIFTAMLEMTDKNMPIDLVSLTNYLKTKEQLEEIGGAAYLAGLLDTPANNPEFHAKSVKEKSLKRQIIQRSNSLMQMAYEDRADLEEILANMTEMSSCIMEKASIETAENLQIDIDILQNHFSSIRETPFDSLNRAIEGLMVGELTIIGGRPGMGKTALVLEILSHTALDEGCPVIYCGAQMSKPRIYARLLAQKCKLSLRKIMGGKISEKDKLEMLHEQHKKINTAPIHSLIIKDRISVPALQAIILNSQSRIGNLGLIVVENLQQLSWPGKQFKSDWDQASFIVEILKQFSYEIKTPLIISSQLNRDVDDREDKRPMPSDIFGKKAEELSDVIIFPFRPNYYEKKQIEEAGRPERNAELIISKGGPPISLPFTFWGDYLSWKEK